MFRLPEAWVWDFWIVDDGEQYHLFFLYASRALKDPDRRHYRASIGHAVSHDLMSWQRVTDALVRGETGSFDELATWTGSVIRHPDGTWFLFYTGAVLTEAGNVQSVGFATSPDLYEWTRHPGDAILEADPRWYEKLADGQWADEAFRDPFVFADPAGDGYHMYITARANHGPADDRGVVGYAWSSDLRSWELRPPLSGPGAGFGQLEVMEYLEVGGSGWLLFNCLASDFSASRRATGVGGGVWLARAEGPLGPFDIAGAHAITEDNHYVGRILEDRSGDLVFLAFVNSDSGGEFVGEITDPLPVNVEGDSPAIEGLDRAG